MKLTTRSEYALLALIHMARERSGECITADAISRAQGIPLAYLEQILRALKMAGLLKSFKGQRGGFRLARKPREITIAEVIRLFDGALAPTQSVSKYFYEATPIQKEPKMLEILGDIRDFIAKKLEKTTIADVV